MTIAVTRVTHSCHMIEVGGQRFPTDPWFSSTEHYHQGEPTAFGVDDLPDLDAVLIGHAHDDRCDLDALSRLRTPFQRSRSSSRPVESESSSAPTASSCPS